MAQTFSFPFVYSPDDPFPQVIIGIDLIGFADIDLNHATRTWRFRNGSDVSFPSIKSIEVAAVQFEISEQESNSLDETGRQRLQEVLTPYANVFVDHGPASTLSKHRIPTGTADSVSSHANSIPAKRRFRVHELLPDMQAYNITEPCESSWASPLVCVVKPTGDLRLCVDYRKVNAITASDRYLMPSIEQLLFRTDKRSYVSLLDLKSGFWQIPVADEDCDKTTFVCEFGLFRFLRMPFGLKGAPATFQRAMDTFARSIPNVKLYPYMDDLIVVSPSFEQHLRDLDMVFSKLNEVNLHVNRDKCRGTSVFLSTVQVPRPHRDTGRCSHRPIKRDSHHRPSTSAKHQTASKFHFFMLLV